MTLLHVSLRSTNAVYKVKMHMITVSVTVSLIKIQLRAFTDLKKVLIDREKLKKKDSQRQNNFLGRACFGWVGRSMANQHF